MRRFWREGIARNVQLLKTGFAEDRLPKMSPKFAPRCGARAISKSKPSKHQRFGPFFEVLFGCRDFDRVSM